MASNSEILHEDRNQIKQETLNRHRAIASLMEELEAVDWYAQRIDATEDKDLRAILEHNRDEEKEHAAMVLEWLRRNDPKLNEYLRLYLFTDKQITNIETEDTEDDNGSDTDSALADHSLAIGSLKENSSV